jgi:hypothetical protein
MRFHSWKKASNDWLSMMSGGNDVGREGGEGGVKKWFLGLRQTALLSAEGKNETLLFCTNGRRIGLADANS